MKEESSKLTFREVVRGVLYGAGSLGFLAVAVWVCLNLMYTGTEAIKAMRARREAWKEANEGILKEDPNRPYPFCKIELSQKALRIKNQGSCAWTNASVNIDGFYKVNLGVLEKGRSKVIPVGEIRGDFRPRLRHSITVQVANWNPRTEICFVKKEMGRTQSGPERKY
jgi:hypothetical protein